MKYFPSEEATKVMFSFYFTKLLFLVIFSTRVTCLESLHDLDKISNHRA